MWSTLSDSEHAKFGKGKRAFEYKQSTNQKLQKLEKMFFLLSELWWYHTFLLQAVEGAVGLPVAVQCVALPWQEELCLRFMKEVEKVSHERMGRKKIWAYSGEVCTEFTESTNKNFCWLLWLIVAFKHCWASNVSNVPSNQYAVHWDRLGPTLLCGALRSLLARAGIDQIGCWLRAHNHPS